MSNPLCAQKKPPFGWYYSWLKLSDIGKPPQDINAGMRQPDMIKGILGLSTALSTHLKNSRRRLKFNWMTKPQTIPRGYMTYLVSACKEPQQQNRLQCPTPFQWLAKWLSLLKQP
eukprot:5604565-Ditylum_brightwellii.AAC.1